jgi:hypothetical protein
METQLIAGELNNLRDSVNHAYCEHSLLTLLLHGAKSRQEHIPQRPVRPKVSLMVYDKMDLKSKLKLYPETAVRLSALYSGAHFC